MRSHVERLADLVANLAAAIEGDPCVGLTLSRVAEQVKVEALQIAAEARGVALPRLRGKEIG